MRLTPGKNWQWNMFEHELLTAATMGELRQAKARTPENLRREVMSVWAADGRYEWLKAKAAALIICTFNPDFETPECEWAKTGDTVAIALPKYISWLIAAREQVRNRNTDVFDRVASRLKSLGASEGQIGGVALGLMKPQVLMKTKKGKGCIRFDGTDIWVPLKLVRVSEG